MAASRLLLLLCSLYSLSVAMPSPASVPHWTAQTPNASIRPFGGLPVVPGVTTALVYNASAQLGLYNHVPMLVFYGSFLAYWVNALVTEGDATRILYAQSADGVAWSAPAVLFPNLTSPGGARQSLYAAPALQLNGRVYAAASPPQTELYPCEWAAFMLLRRVDTSMLQSFGPIFWATNDIPAGLEAATAKFGILRLNETDATTQHDVRGSGMYNFSARLPCDAVAGAATSKCEGCPGGCFPFHAEKPLALNEHTHYALPRGAGALDVEFFRSQWW